MISGKIYIFMRMHMTFMSESYLGLNFFSVLVYQ